MGGLMVALTAIPKISFDLKLSHLHPRISPVFAPPPRPEPGRARGGGAYLTGGTGGAVMSSSSLSYIRGGNSGALMVASTATVSSRFGFETRNPFISLVKVRVRVWVRTHPGGAGLRPQGCFHCVVNRHKTARPTPQKM